jgi:hypothetical protein
MIEKYVARAIACFLLGLASGGWGIGGLFCLLVGLQVTPACQIVSLYVSVSIDKGGAYERVARHRVGLSALCALCLLTGLLASAHGPLWLGWAIIIPVVVWYDRWRVMRRYCGRSEALVAVLAGARQDGWRPILDPGSPYANKQREIVEEWVARGRLYFGPTRGTPADILSVERWLGAKMLEHFKGSSEGGNSRDVDYVSLTKLVPHIASAVCRPTLTDVDVRRCEQTYTARWLEEHGRVVA